MKSEFLAKLAEAAAIVESVLTYQKAVFAFCDVAKVFFCLNYASHEVFFEPEGGGV